MLNRTQQLLKEDEQIFATKVAAIDILSRENTQLRRQVEEGQFPPQIDHKPNQRGCGGNNRQNYDYSNHGHCDRDAGVTHISSSAIVDHFQRSHTQWQDPFELGMGNQRMNTRLQGMCDEDEDGSTT